MKYFLDTEFIDNGTTIDLISIGIVAEDGREYYAQNLDTHFDGASYWVQENVLAKLENREYWRFREGESKPWRRRGQMALDIDEFCNAAAYGRPEFWAYYGAYDWVAVCQLFGTMMKLPGERYRCPECGENCPNNKEFYCSVALVNVQPMAVPAWPKICYDIKQLCDFKGNPRLPKQDPAEEHHALNDARWNRTAWTYLQGQGFGRIPPANLGMR